MHRAGLSALVEYLLEAEEDPKRCRLDSCIKAVLLCGPAPLRTKFPQIQVNMIWAVRPRQSDLGRRHSPFFGAIGMIVPQVKQ